MYPFWWNADIITIAGDGVRPRIGSKSTLAEKCNIPEPLARGLNLPNGAAWRKQNKAAPRAGVIEMLKIIVSSVIVIALFASPHTSRGQLSPDATQEQIYAEAAKQIAATQPTEVLRQELVGLAVTVRQRDEQIAQLKSDLNEALNLANTENKAIAALVAKHNGQDETSGARAVQQQTQAEPAKAVEQFDAGGGFTVSNVSVKPVPGIDGKPAPGSDGICEVIGDVENRSGKDFEVCTFTIALYNASGKLLSSGPAVLWTVESGKTRSFTSVISGVSVGDVSKWRVSLDQKVLSGGK